MFASDVTTKNNFLSSVFQAHFSFKRTLPATNRASEHIYDPSSPRISGSQAISSQTRFSQEASNHLRSGTQPGFSSNQKYDNPRQVFSNGKNSDSDRYFENLQTSHPNQDDPKDISGFICLYFVISHSLCAQYIS